MEHKAKWLVVGALAVTVIGAGGLRSAFAASPPPTAPAPAAVEEAKNPAQPDTDQVEEQVGDQNAPDGQEAPEAAGEKNAPETDKVQHDAPNETGEHAD